MKTVRDFCQNAVRRDSFTFDKMNENVLLLLLIYPNACYIINSLYFDNFHFSMKIHQKIYCFLGGKKALPPFTFILLSFIM